MRSLQKAVASLTVVAIALGIGVLPVFADNSPSQGSSQSWWRRFLQQQKERRENYLEEQKERRNDFKEEQKEKREEVKKEIKNRLSESRRNRLSAFFKRFQERARKMIDRLQRVHDKIAARLTRLSDAGVDVSAQRRDLAAIKVKIDASRTRLTVIASESESIVENNEPKEALEKLRELHKGFLKDLRVIHKDLVRLLASLRGMSPAVPSASPSVSATPTPTPTATPTPTPSS